MDAAKAAAVESQNKKRIGFIGAACSLAAVYAASSAPIPLYSIYRQNISLTNTDLSMSAVAYFIGTAIALLMFARLSNFLGRRPVSLAALGLSAAGCMMFFFLHNIPIFLLGRFIQGLSCGLASSAIAAYTIDTAPLTPNGIGATVTSSAPMIGLGIGSFASGAFAQYSSGSLSWIFSVLIAIIAVCAVLIALGSETVAREKGALASIAPQIRAPKSIYSLIPAASAIFIGTWAIGGFYQAFSSSMAAEQLGEANAIVAAAIFACMMAPNIIGGSLAGRFKTATAQPGGITVFFLSLIVIIISLKMKIIVLFLVASVIAGGAGGLAFTGSMRGILSKTVQTDRAGVLSTIYLISYSGAAVPSLIVGRLPSSFNLLQIAVGYGVLVAATCIVTFFTAAQKSD